MANRFDFIRQALSGSQPTVTPPQTTSTTRNIIGDILNGLKPASPINTAVSAFKYGKKLIQSPVPTITDSLNKASDFLTPDPNNLHLKDVITNLPEGILNMGHDIAQAINREGVALGEALLHDTYHTFTPKGQFAKTVLGTDKPINFENVGRDTFGMAPKTNVNQRTDSPLKHFGLTAVGGLITAADLYTGGIGSKEIEGAASTIAKTTDKKIIEGVLKKLGVEEKGIADALIHVNDVGEVTKVLNGLPIVSPEMANIATEARKGTITTEEAQTAIKQLSEATTKNQETTKALEGLVTEAKKYSTPEEFIQTIKKGDDPITPEFVQKNIERLNESGIKVSSPDEIVTLYHGTNAKGMDGITTSNSLNPFSYLATDPNASKNFAFGRKGGVVEVKVPVKDIGWIQDSMAGTKGVTIQTPYKLVKGADGIYHADRTPFMSAQELTDIWKQSHTSESLMKGTGFNPDITKQQAEEILRKMFNEKELKLGLSSEIKSLEGEKVLGRYIGAHTDSVGSIVKPMVELLTEGSLTSSKALFHESFHAFFDLYLSKAEQLALIEKVKKDPLLLGHKLKAGYASDKLAEEWLADDFAEYVKTKQSPLANIWEKLLNKIRDFVRRKNGFDKVYEDILNKNRPDVRPTNPLTETALQRQKLGGGTQDMATQGEPALSQDVQNNQSLPPENSLGSDGQVSSYNDSVPQNPNITTPPTGRGGITPPEIDFTKWKDQNAFLLNRDTMVRNLDKVAGEDAPVIKEFLTDPVRENEVYRIKFENATREMTRAKVVEDLGIHSGSKEDKLVQRFGEGRMTLEELQKESPKKWKQIQEASDFFRKQYDGILDMINERRTNFGYKEIPKRADYFRHFQEMGKWIESFGLITNSPTSILPTEISGLTGLFKPGKPFTSAELTRKGGAFTESAIKGFDNYIDSVSRQIFHTDSVQRGRTLDKYIRNAAKEGKASLPNFVANVDEWTNFISGKKSKFDSGMEGIFGRRFFEVISALKRRVGANLVGGSVSSAITNFAPFAQSIATTEKVPMIRGLFESLASPLHDEFAKIGGQESSFLFRRFKQERIDPTNYEKFVMGASWVFKNIDRFVAKAVVSGKFYEEIGKGKTAQEAMKAADQYAANVIADRSIGEMPNIFNTKSLGFLTQFQLEVNNVISFMGRDIPEMSKGSKVKYVNQMGQFLLYSMLFNTMYEKVTGRRPILDPIYGLGTMLGVTAEGKNKSLLTRTSNTMQDLGGNLPFGGLVTGGGRFPLTDVLPTPNDVINVAKGKADWHKELTKAFFGLVPPFGGSQLKKTIEGLMDYNRGASKTAGGKVRYKIDDTGGNLLRAIFFGRYSFPEVNDYYNKLEQVKKKTTTSLGL